MNIGISIVICCYNSSERIEETLRHLTMQKIEGIACEILLVDNASSDNTASINVSKRRLIIKEYLDSHTCRRQGLFNRVRNIFKCELNLIAF